MSVNTSSLSGSPSAQPLPGAAEEAALDDTALQSAALQSAALRYAEQGWWVLPVKPRAKQPLTRHGLKDASTDARQVAAWWRRWPTANIGLAIPPGLVVLDLDTADAARRLAAEDRHLPSTVRARTARGAHLWYRVHGRARNRVGLTEGVDLRGVGGYVLAPPSVHPSGAVYRWEVPLRRASIADAPQWLVELLRGSPSTAQAGSAQAGSAQAGSAQAGSAQDRPAADGRPPRRDWYRTLAAPIPRGRRNQTLAEVAGLLFRRLPATAAAELAYCWARVKLTPPLPEREVMRTIDSIAGCELRRQRGAS